MKRIKVLALLGIIVCGLGLAGGLIMIGEGDAAGGLLALLIYGFFMWLSIEVRALKN